MKLKLKLLVEKYKQLHRIIGEQGKSLRVFCFKLHLIRSNEKHFLIIVKYANLKSFRPYRVTLFYAKNTIHYGNKGF